ncbi:MAG: SRPBCC family protein [Lentimicrobium sp.]
MATTDKTKITVEATINAPVEKVWLLWTGPEHITQWNNASDDWHTPAAENDLRIGGKFSFRMEAKDGSMGFDFWGIYTTIEPLQFIGYTLGNERKVEIRFVAEANKTRIVETFDPEDVNSAELQQTGWQAILNNFKKYAETASGMEKLHFEISIKASASKVFSTMIHEKHYAEWTAVFNPTSRYEGSWEKGSDILFIGTDKDGNTGGMISRIKDNIPGRFLSIEHLGIIQNGVKISSGPEAEGWAGMLENYTFTETNGVTQLSVDLDSNEEFKGYFEETWPPALHVLKKICEE